MRPLGSGILRSALALTLVLPGSVDSLDQRIRTEIQTHRSSRIQPAMEIATDLGRRDILFALMLGLAVLDPAAGVSTARLAISSLVASAVVVEGAKRGFGRARPDGDRRAANSSFPSGHAASVCALAVVYAKRWRRAAIPLWLLATMISFSRMYLDRHYASDVIVAAVIGIASGSLMSRWPWARTWGMPDAPVPAGPAARIPRAPDAPRAA